MSTPALSTSASSMGMTEGRTDEAGVAQAISTAPSVRAISFRGRGVMRTRLVGRGGRAPELSTQPAGEAEGPVPRGSQERGQLLPRGRPGALPEEVGAEDLRAGEQRGEEPAPSDPEPHPGNLLELFLDGVLVLHEPERVGSEDGEVDVQLQRPPGSGLAPRALVCRGPDERRRRIGRCSVELKTPALREQELR